MTVELDQSMNTSEYSNYQQKPSCKSPQPSMYQSAVFRKEPLLLLLATFKQILLAPA